ncbi:hypothetical protein ACLKA7_007183 [Drosophila subpalustris]
MAWVLHFGGFIWSPLASHTPDLSSGMFICGVLMLLMEPLDRQHVHSFWRSVWPNSLKMSVALMLLQHVALSYVWDSCSWFLNLTLNHWASNCRLLLAFSLLCYSIYRWLSRKRAELLIPMPNAPDIFCPYCSVLNANRDL